MKLSRKRVLLVLLLSSVLLLLVSCFFFTTVDRTYYTDTEYYRETLAAIDSASIRSNRNIDTIQVGWGKAPLIPEQKLPLAGYSKRNGQPYKYIHDTVWTKAMIFDNGSQELLYVTLDLLIFPPEVTKKILPMLDSIGLSRNKILFSASHTHSSIGGWAPGTIGNLFAGIYDSTVVEWISDSIIKAVVIARKNKQKAKIGYSAVHAGNLVTNRLVGDVEGSIDPWARFIKVQTNEGTTALLSNFSAHATCIPPAFMGVSGGYPGIVCQTLEKTDQIDFVAFSAGAVGSMGPLSSSEPGPKKAKEIADDLSEQVRLIQNFTPLVYVDQLQGLRIPIKMGATQWRISKNIRIRPWVFDWLFGYSSSYISSIRIGDVLIIGTPCDFSGELVSEIELYARTLGIHVMITSFNGGYTGYITKDDWYDLDSYETRMMNWYGPYKGAYLSEIIKRIIDIYAKDNQTDTTSE